MIRAPGKAANAGGVAVSGLEITQDRARMPKTRREISEALAHIMADIHATCVTHAQVEGSGVDYAKGAYIAGYRRVAAAMAAQGLS